MTSSLEVKRPEAATGAAICHKAHSRPSEERSEKDECTRLAENNSFANMKQDSLKKEEVCLF